MSNTFYWDIEVKQSVYWDLNVMLSEDGEAQILNTDGNTSILNTDSTPIQNTNG